MPFKKFSTPVEIDPTQSIECTQEELESIREESEQRRRRLNEITAARLNHSEEV